MLPSIARTALITGASHGIGAEFAWLFAAEGFNLVLVARGETELKVLARELKKAHGVSVTVMPRDLSEAQSVASITKELARRKMRVEVLVNNAGIGAYGLFGKTDWKRERDLLQVNITELTELTKALLPGMLKRKKGRILNVASMAAFQPGPLMAVYYASKAYVLSFSLALSEETRGTGVTVTCLCPGPTRTKFHLGAKMGKSRLFRGLLLDAATVARVGYRACMKGRPLVISGKRNRVMAFATRFSPRMLAARLARMAQE